MKVVAFCVFLLSSAHLDRRSGGLMSLVPASLASVNISSEETTEQMEIPAQGNLPAIFLAIELKIGMVVANT